MDKNTKIVKLTRLRQPNSLMRNMSVALLLSSAPKSTHTNRTTLHCTSQPSQYCTCTPSLFLLGPVTGVLSLCTGQVTSAGRCGPRGSVVLLLPVRRCGSRGLLPRAVSRRCGGVKVSQATTLAVALRSHRRARLVCVGVAWWRARRGAVPSEDVEVIAKRLKQRHCG